MNPAGEKLPSLSESTNPPSPDRYPLLIVEDDAAIRTLVARILRANGFQVSVADTGERALELIADMEAPLLVVDKNLPGMNGLDLIEQVRSTRHDFEAVLMTANADVAALVRGVKLGVFR
jgi:two-component system OmpR family response regulator